MDRAGAICPSFRSTFPLRSFRWVIRKGRGPKVQEAPTANSSSPSQTTETGLVTQPLWTEALTTTWSIALVPEGRGIPRPRPLHPFPFRLDGGHLHPADLVTALGSEEVPEGNELPRLQGYRADT